MNEDLTALSLQEASARLRDRAVTSVELTEACLKKIHSEDKEIHSFILLLEEYALNEARAADAEIGAGRRRGPLHGVPVAVKDLVDMAGVATTAGSALFAGNIAEADADVICRLRQAGAVLLGKLNLHEFAYGGSGVISHFGPVHNPRQRRHITGGSSSGSAAALAAGFCFGAIGTDTAGSIRLPAACCGVVGFKPTYGAVSARGVVPLSWSFDHVGPMARTVGDAARIFEAIAERPVNHAAMETPTKQVRVGVARRFFFDELDPEVASAMERVIEMLRGKHTVSEVDFPVDEDRTVQMRESWDYHATWAQKSPEKYDPQTLARIRRGAEVGDEQFHAALGRLKQQRSRVARWFEEAGVDVVLTPTAPIPAPSFAEVTDDPRTLRAKELVLLRNTRPFNVAGTPAISLPCGVTQAGLPIGLQLAAAPDQDEFLLAFASSTENLLGKAGL